MLTFLTKRFSLLCFSCFMNLTCNIVFDDVIKTYGIPSSDMIYCFIVYHNILKYIISWHTTSHDIMSYHIISYHIILYHIIPHHIIWHCIISYHIISYNMISCHIIISYRITSQYVICYTISHLFQSKVKFHHLSSSISVDILCT